MLLPFGLALVVSLADAEASEAWRAQLAKRASPGSVGLLVEHVADPAVAEYWQGALADANPQTRAAAARAANVTGVASLAPAVRAALEKETDIEAGAEEILALAALSGSAEDSALATAAGRLGGVAARQYVLLLARTRGPAAIEDLAMLPAGDWKRWEVIELATLGRKAPLVRCAIVALRKQDAEAWHAVLWLARERGVAIDPGLVASAVASGNPGLRGPALFHVAAMRAAAPDQPVAPVIDGVLQGLTPASILDRESAFALDLVGRMRGSQAAVKQEWIDWITNEPLLPWGFVLRQPQVYPYLTAAEGRALSMRLTESPDELANAAKEWAKLPKRPPAPSVEGDLPAAAPVLRLLNGLPTGMLADLMRAAGCTVPGSRPMLGAEVAYEPSGRPKTIAFGQSDLRGVCLDAGRAALTLDLAPPNERLADPRHAVFLVYDKDWIECGEAQAASHGDRAAPGASATPRTSADIKEPRKVRNLPPVYPAAVKQANGQGQVVLGVKISRTGCIGNIQVLKGSGLFAISALQAVSGWRYTPTLLNGEAVPVNMTVTINFH